MKKYFKGILATTMVLSMTAALAGCGGSGETAATDAAEGGEAKDTLRRQRQMCIRDRAYR